ncbi:DinB family protein [Pedobacter sp. GSP4]|uniref:DinB family protein n=1 Tax=Pedobacter sp. GSP4 TaxID=3453716 RepID=UPI003EEFC268
MEKVIKEATDSLSTLEQLLMEFDPQQINEVPFAGSWTAGQLAQHLVMANSGFLQVINGPVSETSRPADINVEKIKHDFLNFQIKFDSPKEIYPEDKPYDQSALLANLKHISNAMAVSVAGLDLTKTCTSFELPVYGFLTRLEAIYFVIYHTQRHNYQLKNIFTKLNQADFN